MFFFQTLYSSFTSLQSQQAPSRESGARGLPSCAGETEDRAHLSSTSSGYSASSAAGGIAAAFQARELQSILLLCDRWLQDLSFTLVPCCIRRRCP